MGASRKLQGEIDRVLKKVHEGVEVFDSIWNKVYDTENVNQKEKFEADLKKEIKKLQRYRDQIKTWIQSSEIKDKKALMEARKLIEKEMERFKVCEKETKTKAFSKEGLGQQPKTDPKEKAKSETRDWLNNVVGDLETQIDSFEAEVEGLSVKKGKTRPPRLVHLETSIARHKAHILKLELILRLLDNDELSPEQVNDVKEFLEDYVERNQDDFEDFSDVDDLYSSLPLEKVEALEDLVGSSGLVKDARKLHNMVPHQAVGSVTATNAALGFKSSLTTSSSLPIDSLQDQSEETGAHDGNSDSFSKTPPSKSTPMQSLVSTATPNVVSGMQSVPISSSTGSAPTRPLVGGPSLSSIFSAPANTRSGSETAAAVVSSSLPIVSSSIKEDDNINFPGRRSSPAIPEIGLGRGISRGLSSQSSLGAPTNLVSISGISGPPGLGSATAVSDVPKRNILTVDERISTGGIAQSVVSPLSNRTMLQQVSKAMDGTTDSNNVGEGPAVARVFSPSPVTGVQWRPQTPSSFQTQHEIGQVRGRPEIAPDQREKFLQRLQQVQQQGPGNLLGAPILSGVNTKQFSSQPQNSFLQQFNLQSSSLSPQVGLGLGIQAHNLNSVASPQQSPIHQQSSQHSLIPSGSKDDLAHTKIEEPQQQNLPEDSNVQPAISSGFNKIINEDELKSAYVPISSSVSESAQLPRDTDISPGQPLQPTLPSAGLGFFGRRSTPDLGAIGDNISSSIGSSGVMHDDTYNKQMLDAALARLPLPTDSDCIRSYVPRHPAVTPASYAQQQAPVINNPAFWERLGIDPHGTDVLFFAFYFQQKTYQQYLAAKELKRWAWRYHKKYNTWFQRHEEPKVTTDEFERGTYVYFDFHIADDGSQHGWCQRIKTEFTFEYNYLEDELVV